MYQKMNVNKELVCSIADLIHLECYDFENHSQQTVNKTVMTTLVFDSRRHLQEFKTNEVYKSHSFMRSRYEMMPCQTPIFVYQLKINLELMPEVH